MTLTTKLGKWVKSTPFYIGLLAPVITFATGIPAIYACHDLILMYIWHRQQSGYEISLPSVIAYGVFVLICTIAICFSWRCHGRHKEELPNTEAGNPS